MECEQHTINRVDTDCILQLRYQDNSSLMDSPIFSSTFISLVKLFSTTNETHVKRSAYVQLTCTHSSFEFLCGNIPLMSTTSSETTLPFHRMLIQYGLMRGLIRHLQKYPVLVETNTARDTLPESLQPYIK